MVGGTAKKFDRLPAEEREVQTKLIAIRKSLRAPEETPRSIKWKTLPEFQETFTSLPLSDKRESVMSKRLSKYSGFASAEEFDFCSTDAWANTRRMDPTTMISRTRRSSRSFRKMLRDRCRSEREQYPPDISIGKPDINKVLDCGVWGTRLFGGTPLWRLIALYLSHDLPHRLV
jgi:hypothetical protein